MKTLPAKVLKRRIEYCLEVMDFAVDEFGNVTDSTFYDVKAELDDLKTDVDSLVELLKEVY